MCTAWLILAGTQIIRDVGDMARFGSILFQILAPLQLALLLFMSAIQTASAVAQEKDRKTMILLLMTRMTSSELVLGRLFASLLHVVTLIASALPIFLLISLFGGVSISQILWTFAATLGSAVAAASLGSMFALWREKTFQALALTVVSIVTWIGLWEGLAFAGYGFAGFTSSELAITLSPVSAIQRATHASSDAVFGDGVLGFVLFSVGVAIVVNSIAIWRVRIWNPSRELRPGQQGEMETVSIFDGTTAVDGADNEAAESARSGHVDARTRTVSQTSRRVWDNPILWREARTWAYGKKIVFIKIAYVLLFLLAFAGLYVMQAAAATDGVGRSVNELIPSEAKIIGPVFLMSLVLVNALAVTSITNERDGRSLDLLLVTDLSPKEFLIGKLAGVLYVTREMVALPFLMPIYLLVTGDISPEIALYVMVGLMIMNLFVGVLGIHCGMIYSNSRQAIGVSLGTVFFLFLGIMTCMFMMVSFTGKFQAQLMPFLAFIVGGGVGLYVVLGHRNPSPAIATASGVLPLAMFFAITSFLLGRPLSVFLVISATFGFTITAMVMPALGEFNIAMGRSRTAEED